MRFTRTLAVLLIFLAHDAAAMHWTVAGVPLPRGWRLRERDHFGAQGTIRTVADLRTRYCDNPSPATSCQLRGPIPGWAWQADLVPFEQAIVFRPDHLEIEARGHPDGAITTGLLISRRSWRSFCVEARYQISAVPGSWPAFWCLGAGSAASLSELDVEQPIAVTPLADGEILTAQTVELYNHPTQGTVTPSAPGFDLRRMTFHTTTDYSAAPHTYTICYDDAQATNSRWIDGTLIYVAWDWQWTGPLAHVNVSLLVGGWPGTVAAPSTYSATLALYAIDYYAPNAARTLP